MREIYRAGWQGSKLIGLMLIMAGLAAGSVWWGLDLYRHYGLSPGDGGVLAPLGQRVLAAGVVIGLGMAFLLAMVAFGRIYVMSVAVDGTGRTLYLRTLIFLWPVTRQVSAADVMTAGFVDLENPRGRSTPYVWVRVKGSNGRARRFLVDLQGKVLDPAALQRALRGSTPSA